MILLRTKGPKICSGLIISGESTAKAQKHREIDCSDNQDRNKSGNELRKGGCIIGGALSGALLLSWSGPFIMFWEQPTDAGADIVWWDVVCALRELGGKSKTRWRATSPEVIAALRNVELFVWEERKRMVLTTEVQRE